MMSPDFKIGIQLYGLQDNFRKDMQGTLKALAGFGYQGIELIPIPSLGAQSVASGLLQSGLQAAGYYVFDPRKLLAPDDALYGELKTLGIHDVTIGFSERVANDWEAAIADVQARMAKRLEVTAERTLRELAKVAFYDPREMYDAGGRPLLVGELDDMNAAALAGIETAVKEEDGVVTVTHKYRMTDRVKALELLGRYHKLFTDKVEHGGSVTLEQLVAGSMTHEGGEAQSG